MSTLPHLRHAAPDSRHLDGNRILAQAGMLVLHVVALMLLLTPARISLPVAPPSELVVVAPPVLHRPPPPKPIEAAIAAPHPASTPLPAVPRVERTTVAPVDDAPVFETAGPLDLPALPRMAADAGPAIPDLSPLTGARLAYASAPPPPYPPAAVRMGRSGTVLLEVTVDAEGRPVDVRVVRSSGHRDLDRSALQQVLRHWRFQPAMRDGHAVTAVGRIPVDFRL